MRILYVDIDCLRPDHLGCYGYHRATSPNIDQLAARGVRFDSVYVSDAPCLPSRTALFSQRFGVKTGVVNHGGARASMYNDGTERGFGDRIGRTSFMRGFRDAGYHTATVTPFIERHAAWHFAAGWKEILNPGKRGLETADDIAGWALGWLDRFGKNDKWFLHVNFWDPHTPYRTPPADGDPFKNDPLPSWYTQAVLDEHKKLPGPHSANEVMGFDDESPRWAEKYPRQPFVIDSLAQARRMFDGYDAGIRYADGFIGQLLERLERLGIAGDTAVWLSSDHGENLGELNVYGDHQTADEYTCRVPSILVIPGVTTKQGGRVDRALHYQMDVGATLLELSGGTCFEDWDSRSFSDAFRKGTDAGRDALILSQSAWTCQRAVRFRHDDRELLWIHTRHDGFHGYPEEMLFDLGADPHERQPLSDPDAAAMARSRLDHFLKSELAQNPHGDPMDEVLAEGGPFHVRGALPAYLERLRKTDRARFADEFARRRP
jgi:arylsulfatase A-like enzyme